MAIQYRPLLSDVMKIELFKPELFFKMVFVQRQEVLQCVICDQTVGLHVLHQAYCHISINGVL